MGMGVAQASAPNGTLEHSTNRRRLVPVRSKPKLRELLKTHGNYGLVRNSTSECQKVLIQTLSGKTFEVSGNESSNKNKQLRCDHISALLKEKEMLIAGIYKVNPKYNRNLDLNLQRIPKLEKVLSEQHKIANRAHADAVQREKSRQREAISGGLSEEKIMQPSEGSMPTMAPLDSKKTA